MNKTILQWVTFAFLFFITFGTLDNPFLSQHLQPSDTETVAFMDENDPLYSKIEQAAPELNEPAIDATIHRVWKGIPGLNGLKVDIEASYRKMKKEGEFSKEKLIFKEVSPDVHLSDLPPAPIYKGNPQKSMVSLMVNVAWGNQHLRQILQVMEKMNVHSTFFLDGSWVNKHPELAKTIAEEGHEIGNHAYSHPDLKRMGPDSVKQELTKTNAVVEKILNIKPKLFAPPSGSYNESTVTIADSLGMKTILWSVDTVDWNKPRPEDMIQKVLTEVHGGALILMHPTQSTVDGLDDIIRGIRERGYEIRPVSRLLSEDRV